MKNGRIAIFEDDPGYMEALKIHVTLGGNEVVICSTSREKALADIRDRVERLGSLAVDIALVDGNLSGDTSNEDGREIAALLREHGGEELFILSNSGTEELIGGADMKTKPALSKDITHQMKIVEGYIAPHELEEHLNQAA